MFDVHSHFIPEKVLQWVELNQDKVNARWVSKGENQPDLMIINDKWAFTLSEAFINEDLHRSEQIKAGIQHTLVSPLPQLFLYDFPPEITAELSSIYNREIMHLVERNKDVYSGLATIPLNDPELAAKELKCAMEAGLKGAIIGTGVSELLLTDSSFLPVWEEADRLGAILFIHPLLSEDRRLEKRRMSTLSGVLWETTVCSTDILLSGYLDRFRNVKIILAHGGGFLPYQIGRLNRGYEQWDDVSQVLKAPPIDYLKRFWFDSVLWNKEAHDYLLSIVGVDRVLPGSDFPFEISEFPPNHSDQTAWKKLFL
ncbi:amidohydrolase family protein [Sporosarcina ureae]|uniref:amidohydrolase family protein n=1 Tax=Sporosarcina ureae TaxID=1571 RepID=UPI0009DC71CB|nr:amidohydrolase family protein [Sporosarcina ureae]ARF17619.1 amidohydrolase [Sporosarcina ureae]